MKDDLPDDRDWRDVVGVTFLLRGAIIFRLAEEVVAAVDNVPAKASSCLNQ